MSTDIHLVCLSHDPVIISDEVGTTNSIDRVRKQVADRDKIVAAFHAVMELGVWPDLDGNEKTVWWFLKMHPVCQIGIRDEYGEDISPFSEEDESVTHSCSCHTKPGPPCYVCRALECDKDTHPMSEHGCDIPLDEHIRNGL